MITDVVTQLKILLASYSTDTIQTTRLELYVPLAYPAINIEPETIDETGDLLLETTTDYEITLNICYVESIPIAKATTANAFDCMPFVKNVESIMKTLRANPRLNGTMDYFKISEETHDNAFEDNFEFIAIITISGQCSS